MNIKEARKAAGLTQQGMSDRLGIPKRTIESWEGGQRKCPEWAERLIVEKLNQIAKEKTLKEYTWYAVLEDADDDDWGTGSFDYNEAVEMAKKYGSDARIAVISGWAENEEDEKANGLRDTECKKIIPSNEF